MTLRLKCHLQLLITILRQLVSLTSISSAIHFSQPNKNVTIPFLWNGTIPFHSTLFQNRTHPCIVVNCCPYTAIPFHLHLALYASVCLRVIQYHCWDLFPFLCRLKLLRLYSSGCKMRLMRLLWGRWCRHHLPKTSTSTRPWASWVVTF